MHQLSSFVLFNFRRYRLIFWGGCRNDSPAHRSERGQNHFIRLCFVCARLCSNFRRLCFLTLKDIAKSYGRGCGNAIMKFDFLLNQIEFRYATKCIRLCFVCARLCTNFHRLCFLTLRDIDKSYRRGCGNTIMKFDFLPNQVEF